MKNRIKELRCEKKIGQYELAEKLGLSQRSIAFYEGGQRDPNTDTLSKLADFFNCSIDYLFCRTSQKNYDIDEKKLRSLYIEETKDLTADRKSVV